jgi:hypothetical protein
MSTTSIPAAIHDRIATSGQVRVWTPEDFADLGPRNTVDQALHRLVATNRLRRIARGLYDHPQENSLTGKPTNPKPRDVIDALSRKGKVRIVVDGITAANDLGLTDAVPARISVLTDGRLQPITLGCGKRRIACRTPQGMMPSRMPHRAPLSLAASAKLCRNQPIRVKAPYDPGLSRSFGRKCRRPSRPICRCREQARDSRTKHRKGLLGVVDGLLGLHGFSSKAVPRSPKDTD